MRKAFSLLYKNEETSIPCDILYDLSIDRAMHRIFSDRKRTDYFLDVIKRPLTSVENIEYRQQIFADFLAFPELFEKLNLQFTRYDRIKSDWQEMKLGAPPSSVSNPEALLDHTYASLKVTSMFPSTIASFFYNLCDILSKYDIQSSALCDMRDYCREMTNNDSLAEIVGISGLFRYHTPEHFTFDTTVTLDQMLRAYQCELCGIAEPEEKTKFSLPLGKLFAKKEQGPITSVKLCAEGTISEDASHLLSEALRRIDLALTRVTNQLYDVMYGLSRELYFYEVGLAYYRHVQALSLPACIPSMLPMEDDRLILRGVSDLLLSTVSDHPERIVANDMEIDGVDGILVKGLTDTGKTVYLRSCATAMIFAQAGLPILASDATLSIRSAFFSHFSCAEEEFLKGDVTGRFDQEAKEIAAILDAIQPHSLILLNETFQTTSYQEGTEAIYNILSILPRIKVKFLFVTHLTALFDRMDKAKVCLMQTDESKQYRLKKIK